MSDKILVFASHNINKVKELKALIGPTTKLLSLSELGFKKVISETGTTLRENARIKAHFVYTKYHGRLRVLSDDTGLEVNSLNGAPGVYSARYAKNRCSDEENIDKLLNELRNSSCRKAQFRTVFCLIEHGEEYFFEGIVIGEIITQKRGVKGFGYDPIFSPLGYDLTFGEMSIQVKNQISHRGKALKKLQAHLNQKLKPQFN